MYAEGELFPTKAETKNGWNYTPNSPYAFKSCAVTPFHNTYLPTWSFIFAHFVSLFPKILQFCRLLYPPPYSTEFENKWNYAHLHKASLLRLQKQLYFHLAPVFYTFLALRDIVRWNLQSDFIYCVVLHTVT